MNSRIESAVNEPEESGCLDVVFSDVYTIARWAETGGSGNYPVIRLQRPFAPLLDFPKKIN